MIYFSDEKSDMLLLRSGKNTALINSSQYSKGLSYDALGYLNDNHINSLDKYIITHYAYRLEEDFDILLSNILISEISLPFPKNEDEERLYNLLSKSVEEYSVELTLHAESGTINLGNFRYIPLYSHAYGEGSSHNAYLLVYKNTTQYLYLSSGMLCDELLHTYEKLLPEVDVLIFGSHGKKYKEYIYLEYDLLMAKKIIFSGEKLFLTQDAYRSYIKKGCEIYSHPYTVKILDVK